MSFSFDNTGKFTTLSQGQAVSYELAFRKYLEVQNFNSNISTMWASGDTSSRPYRFSGSAEKTLFQRGQMIFEQANPGSNVNLIRPE